jgi:hypothetical protein
MKLSIVRGGGLSGLVTRTELDTDRLSAETASSLEEKLAGAGELAESAAPEGRHPDEMSYEVTVEDDSGRRSARFTDSTLPEPLRSLIAWADSQPESTTSVQPPT